MPFAAALDDSVPSSQGYGTAAVTKAHDDVEVEAMPMMAGFELWVPPRAARFNDGLPIYEIIGTDAQIVQFPLRAGRKIMCFSGAMAYMSDGMKLDLKLAGLGKAFGRLAGGGSLFQLTYTNETEHDGYVAMTPDYPGVIIPVDMKECPSGKVIAQRDSFLCSTVGLGLPETEVSGGFNPASSVGGKCCAGVDFIVQTVSNGEWAFLMGMGTIVQKSLASDEQILVDGDSVLAFEHTVEIDVKWIGSGLACCCAGEGLLNTTMKGPGKIWLQSMSIDKMRTLFPPHVVSSGDGGGGDEGGGD